MSALRVAYSLDELAALRPQNSAVTIGVFDGVHRGHRRIVEALLASRGTSGVESAFLLTFDPHPTVVTHSRATPPVLSTIEERLQLLSDLPLDGVFVLRFDEATARLSYGDFIERYLLSAMGMRRLVIGYDCHVGHRREGSPRRIEEMGRERGFDVEIVPAVEFGGHVVSSTNIRDRLLAGALGEANELLGHPYLFCGRVVSGQGRGRDLGFPTANIAIDDPRKLWPPLGVHAVRAVWRGHSFDGMMNVGSAPTIKGGANEIEVHLFDFDHTLYGDRLSVYCVAYLRAERAFQSVDALVEQLSADRRAARAVLAG